MLSTQLLKAHGPHFLTALFVVSACAREASSSDELDATEEASSDSSSSETAAGDGDEASTGESESSDSSESTESGDTTETTGDPMGECEFFEPLVPADYGSALFDMVTGDVNGDGFDDAVCGQAHTYLSDGTALLEAPIESLDGAGAAELHLADLNGDEQLDLIVEASDSVFLGFLGDGAGSFSAGPAGSTPPEFAAGGYDLTLVDWDADGAVDVVARGSVFPDPSDVGAHVHIYLNDGSGAFAWSGSFALTDSGSEIHAADLNGDEFPDLVMPLGTDGFEVVLGDGTSSPAPGTVYDGHWVFSLGDVDDDGHVDLVEAQGLRVRFGDGTGAFSDPGPDNGDGGGFSSLADLDGDGHADFVSEGPFGVRVFTGDGAGAFVQACEMLDMTAPVLTPQLADVNGDGKVDMIANNLGTGPVVALGL